MLDTYIKNRGTTKTLVYNNNHNSINEITWDADYDGTHANISLDFQNNGRLQHYDVMLDNEDLANILNIPSVRSPLEKRLRNDFIKPSRRKSPVIYKVEIGDNIKSPIIPTEKLLQDTPYISSPLPNEELIVPFTHNKTSNKYTITPKRRHRKIRTHKTYKVYKKHIHTIKHKTPKKKGHKTKTYRFSI